MKWPSTAPIIPNGITTIIMVACAYDFSGIASNEKIINDEIIKSRSWLSAPSISSWILPVTSLLTCGYFFINSGIKLSRISLATLNGSTCSASTLAQTLIVRLPFSRRIRVTPSCSVITANSDKGNSAPFGAWIMTSSTWPIELRWASG